MTRITGPLGAINPEQPVPPEVQLTNRLNEILDKQNFSAKELASIKKEFSCLSPDVRKFMYREMYTGQGPLAQKFDTLSIDNQDALLLALNPEHEPRTEEGRMKGLEKSMKELNQMFKIANDAPASDSVAADTTAQQFKFADAAERHRIEMRLKAQDPNSLKIDDPVSNTIGKDGKKIP
jgi:hypothetical protein